MQLPREKERYCLTKMLLRYKKSMNSKLHVPWQDNAGGN
jgi:hypothetical protein